MCFLDPSESLHVGMVVERCPPPVSEISRALSANRPLPVSRAIVQR